MCYYGLYFIDVDVYVICYILIDKDTDSRDSQSVDDAQVIMLPERTIYQ